MTTGTGEERWLRTAVLPDIPTPGLPPCKQLALQALQQYNVLKKPGHQKLDTPVCSNAKKEEPTPGAAQFYSVGHSDHSMEAFVNLLRKYQISLVVDVRSQPYSQWAPQFNRESLACNLEAMHMRYLFMGDALGGRPADRAFYDAEDEHPNYERLAQSPTYQAGIEHLLALAQSERVAIMCSEGDYHKCHRTRLITPTLLQRGARVFHILPDGTQIEAQPEAHQLSMF